MGIAGNQDVPVQPHQEEGWTMRTLLAPRLSQVVQQVFTRPLEYTFGIFVFVICGLEIFHKQLSIGILILSVVNLLVVAIERHTDKQIEAHTAQLKLQTK